MMRSVAKAVKAARANASTAVLTRGMASVAPSAAASVQAEAPVANSSSKLFKIYRFVTLSHDIVWLRIHSYLSIQF